MISSDRLAMKIGRPTLNGGRKELCKFERSKTISVEHFFRSIGLYPRLVYFQAESCPNLTDCSSVGRI